MLTYLETFHPQRAWRRLQCQEQLSTKGWTTLWRDVTSRSSPQWMWVGPGGGLYTCLSMGILWFINNPRKIKATKLDISTGSKWIWETCDNDELFLSPIVHDSMHRNNSDNFQRMGHKIWSACILFLEIWWKLWNNFGLSQVQEPFVKWVHFTRPVA